MANFNIITPEWELSDRHSVPCITI